jgi:nucleoside-diphosphate-sugar epimerase
MKKTILIGPSGFLGYSFLKEYPDIIAVGRNKPKLLNNEFIHIKDDNDFESLKDIDFNNVIFLIGSSHHELLNNTSVLALEKNALPLAKFLFFLKSNNIKVDKIITFTTMLQYHNQKLVLPCKESNPRNPYSNNYVFSKYVAEMLSEQYRDLFSIIDLRISNVYGPFYYSRPDLIPSLIEKAIKGKKLSVWTKKSRRDFIYVKDAVDAVIKLLECDYSGPLNLGTGVSHSVKEICDVIEELTKNIILDEDIEVSGHMEYYHDISLLQSLINWRPYTPMYDGIKKTYIEMKYFHENLNLY